MRVLASKGIKVPKEFKPKEYITDTAPDGAAGFEVAESAYYLRRIADGDLNIVADDAGSVSAKK